MWRGGRLRAAVAGFRPFPHAILTIEYYNEDATLLSINIALRREVLEQL